MLFRRCSCGRSSLLGGFCLEHPRKRGKVWRVSYQASKSPPFVLPKKVLLFLYCRIGAYNMKIREYFYKWQYYPYSRKIYSAWPAKSIHLPNFHPFIQLLLDLANLIISIKIINNFFLYSPVRKRTQALSPSLKA